ncbi:MAG: Alpha-ribazole phosphatase [Candidatus Woesebacteria bacterium GW2011_GWB1_38_5b]|uniref:Alpha-ribazole phosphatase n=1 Tax=Candidatus Woesebacteria bacterium GW2011_GWB1_38_5b TaxID=1618569 RepID=A0A0G0KII3_9BACT|nr:MAG: Alpha-ribazole phosphatase [Candidatus Woesebacteria bacterium GW2011_GWB1_38_5b]OGH47734.1 MAG: hypothetical protein A3A51_04840 [Candidatus Levybacteria bacterium RIFCSPLOWO2_01_FULL_39_10]
MNDRLTTIYVMRHGQSTFNTGETHNDLNSRLTDLGRRQTYEAAERFKDIDFKAIFTSGLLRTKETAEIINQGRKLKIYENKDINERSFYHYAKQIKREGVDLEEEMLNEIVKLDEKDKMKYKYTPEMESAEESAVRVLNFLQDIGKKYLGETVLVVSHTNLMRSILTFLGYSKYDELPAGSVKNTGYFILETDGENFSVTDTHNIEKQKNAIRVW